MEQRSIQMTILAGIGRETDLFQVRPVPSLLSMKWDQTAKQHGQTGEKSSKKIIPDGIGLETGPLKDMSIQNLMRLLTLPQVISCNLFHPGKRKRIKSRLGIGIAVLAQASLTNHSLSSIRKALTAKCLCQMERESSLRITPVGTGQEIALFLVLQAQLRSSTTSLRTELLERRLARGLTPKTTPHGIGTGIVQTRKLRGLFLWNIQLPPMVTL
mmetsp:Transcript_3841/g.8150  ORF Transcript_3841/g.8150 Transcript_3841/m.8150 type:complete len:214 (+) Transcript_3841:2717-3358(+)